MKGLTLEIKWGFIFTAVSLAWALLEKLLGFHDSRIESHALFTNVFFIPAVAVYWFALREKKQRLGGSITFRQAFMSGLIISIIVALLTPLQQVIVHRVISPEYFNTVKGYAVSHGQMTAAEADAYFNLKNYIVQSAIFAPIAGIITTLVIAFILSRKKATR